MDIAELERRYWANHPHFTVQIESTGHFVNVHGPPEHLNGREARRYVVDAWRRMNGRPELGVF